MQRSQRPIMRIPVIGTGKPSPDSRPRLVDASGREPVNPPASLISCASPSMRELAARVDRVSATDATVLISGEAGSGKTMLAHQVHAKSRRGEAPLVVLHAYQAGTAAFDRLVQSAAPTVLVEEVGELPPDAQGALLRLLAEPAQPRVIGTTSANLGEMVARQRFRADLLYRLDVVRLSVPPLRQRAEDIIPLAEYFLSLAARSFGRALLELSPDAEACLLRHTWPGNVRELSNCILESILHCAAPSLGVADLRLRVPAGPEGNLADVLARLCAQDPHDLYRRTDRLVLQWALAKCAGNYVRAASLLGIGRSAFRTKLRRYGLTPAVSRSLG